MQNNVTKVAAIRALFLLFVQESGAAYLYFNIDNPEILPFIVAFAIAGVLGSVWVFNFVRASQATRLKWIPRIFLAMSILGALMSCGSMALVILSLMKVIDYEIGWSTLLYIATGIYFSAMFWSQRRSILQGKSGVV